MMKSAFLMSSGLSVKAMPRLSFAPESSRIPGSCLHLRQRRSSAGAWRTQVQAGVRRSPSRRCRWFCLLVYDPFETPCYSFSIYPPLYTKTSPTLRTTDFVITRSHPPPIKLPEPHNVQNRTKIIRTSHFFHNARPLLRILMIPLLHPARRVHRVHHGCGSLLRCVTHPNDA